MSDEGELSVENLGDVVLRADAAGAPLPDFVDERRFSSWLCQCGLRPEVNAALHRLPPARFSKFSNELKKVLAECEADLPQSTPIAFAEWVNDPAFEQNWIDGVVMNAHEALRKKNFYSAYHTLTSMFESALGGSVYAVGLLDRALKEIATHKDFGKSETGAQLRLMFRRVRFNALRGTPRDIEMVTPGEDIRFVHRAYEGIGKKEPLALLSQAQIDALFEAWAAIDWDSTLYLSTVFERESSPPPIETRPWAELVALVGKTSLQRLVSGQHDHQSLSRLFGRPEPLAERIALAESIAEFAKLHGEHGPDAMKQVLSTIIPPIAAANIELTGALEAAAFKAFRDGEIKAVLFTLPRRQVDAWIDKLAKGKNEKHKQLAKEYAKEYAKEIANRS